jgi:hypothetical protein
MSSPEKSSHAFIPSTRSKSACRCPPISSPFWTCRRAQAAAHPRKISKSRFWPILLAFLTNFAGFLPTLLETSPQAQFLIPMTLSLSAGLLLGMAASLILTPVCYAALGRGR